MLEKTRYMAAEAATVFIFSELATKIKNETRKRYPDLSDEKVKDLVLQSLKKFTLNDQNFEFVCSSNYLGGYRWYVICPKCGKQCIKLYLPQNFPGRDQKYYCKECHELRNSSTLMGATKKYKKVTRPLKKLEALKQKILRKGLSASRSKTLLDEYERLERELKTSPEYRLWEFKNKHSLSE